MLSKPAVMLLGLMYKEPLNAYEIVKRLTNMNIKWWFNIGDSTVYATIKSLEKRGFIMGTVERSGSMPERTVYALSEDGRQALKKALRDATLTFDYDTNTFTIAAFFLDIFDAGEQMELLSLRLKMLNRCLDGITEQQAPEWIGSVPAIHVANVERMADIVRAEISGAEKLLSACRDEM